MMKSIHTLAAAASLAFGILVAAGVQAQPATASETSAQSTTGDLAQGEVRKVDKESGKITLKHGPIKNLDMPAMTMVFRAKSPDLLDKVKQGDKVRFAATNEGGQLTVTRIEPMNQ